MKLYFSALIYLFFYISIFAQTLEGKVFNQNQRPVQEVTILNKTNDQHTHSDEQGRFLLEKITIGDTLQFSHISYKNKLVVITDTKEPLKVILTTNAINLNEVVIYPSTNTLNLITDIDIQTNPVFSSQEILRKVPGLFIGQHAGGGKAEQMFLRGFDIDHGTDISLTVDGLPVNMVSHAHGQGYADLHFVIPETIEKIDFGKGPYYENKGNFNTAGYVDFITKSRLEGSSIKLEGGQFETLRLLGMLDLLNNTNHSAYVATEFLASDGPFESPQNFQRVNLFGKYTGLLSSRDKIGVTLSHFNSNWDASGQIPQRAVDQRLISRFGAIDDTEGGTTSRSNLLIDYDKIINENSSLNSTAYLSKSDFELYSNFTFFLEDPINGDQIRQKENRTIYGFSSEYNSTFSKDEIDGSWQAGINLRHDQVEDNELSHTANRQETLEQIQFGNVRETNIGGYVGTHINIGKWSFNPSIRLDYFDFQYYDALLSEYSPQTEKKQIVSPKINILFNPSQKLQLYLKTGKGFHSNDTRVIVREANRNTIPAAYGADLGAIWKPTPKMLLNVAYWYLYLEQEFVYVGDAGIVEPSGKTRRQGIDLSYRYQPLPWLFWNLDVNYAHARAIEEDEGQDYIPLAPDLTLVSGINIVHESGFYGSINVRHLKDRPANEDNSIVAEGYTITDLTAGYKWNKFSLGIQVQNLFDTEWNETQFATESRLQNEIQPVEEIHFTPGVPFFLKGIVQYNF